MEYIFGYTKRNGVMVENLKTVGAEHSDLKDFIQIERQYADSTITDVFRVAERYYSEIDESGKCYDWYFIDSHWRNIEKLLPEEVATSSEKVAALEEQLATTQMAIDAILMGEF